MTEDIKSKGIAYGFFYCSATKDEIERVLPAIRKGSLTPDNLELLVQNEINPNLFRDDPELEELAGLAKDQGNNYTMIGNLPNSTNERTATELGIIQNALYQSPLQGKFHKDGEKPYGGIVYKKDDRYEFLE